MLLSRTNTTSRCKLIGIQCLNIWRVNHNTANPVVRTVIVWVPGPGTSLGFWVGMTSATIA